MLVNHYSCSLARKSRVRSLARLANTVFGRLYIETSRRRLDPPERGGSAADVDTSITSTARAPPAHYQQDHQFSRRRAAARPRSWAAFGLAGRCCSSWARSPPRSRRGGAVGAVDEPSSRGARHGRARDARFAEGIAHHDGRLGGAESARAEPRPEQPRLLFSPRSR
jgi:hypothetical protein